MNFKNLKKMKILQKSLLVALTYFAMVATINAQNTPAWTAEFEKTIEWSKLLPNGILLLGTSDYGLHGVDPETGKIIWSEEKIMREVSAVRGADGKKLDYSDQFISPLGDFDPELLDFISIKFTDSGMLKNLIVINTKTGKIIFHPSEFGSPSVKILGKTAYQFNYGGSGVIPELDLIILQVNYVDLSEKGKPHHHFIKGIDLKTGQEFWKIEGIAGEFLPYLLKDKNLLYFNNHSVAKIEPRSGKLIWRNDLGSDKKDEIKQITYDLDEKTAYVFGMLNKRASIIALDIQSGKQLWNNEFKAKGEPELVATRNGLVMSDDKNFVMYDFATGSEKWKARKLDGDVVDMGSDGVLVSAREKYLTLLDGATGVEKWSKKVKGIRIDQVTDKGIIYYDEKNSLGAVDYRGEEFWKKNIPNIVATTQANFTTMIILSDNDLYKIDLTDFSQTLLAKNIKFKGDEEPETIEAYEQGIVISSSQNHWLVDQNGEIKYQNFYRAPGHGMVVATKILKTTMMVAGTAMASANAYQQGLAGNNTSLGRQYGTERKAWEDFTNGIGKIDASRSYKKATKNSDRYSYVLTRVEEDDQKGVGILKLDKISGETVGQIILKDSKPVYEVDSEKGKIFHRVSKNSVACYNL
jgi:outer membrane protein assembly factor BamB